MSHKSKPAPYPLKNFKKRDEENDPKIPQQPKILQKFK